MLPAGEDSLMTALRFGDGPKACQAIRGNRAAGLQVPAGLPADRLGAEARDRADLGVDRVSGLAQGERRDDRKLVFRSATALLPAGSLPR